MWTTTSCCGCFAGVGGITHSLHKLTLMPIVFCVALVLYFDLTGVADYTARSLSRLFVLSYPSVTQSKVGPYCLSETLSSPVCHCAKILFLLCVSWTCFHPNALQTRESRGSLSAAGWFRALSMSGTGVPAECYRRKHIAVSILCLIAFWFWYDGCLLRGGALSGVDQAKWWAKREVFFYFFDHEEPTPSCCVCSTGEIMDIFTYARPCSLHWSSPAAGAQSVQC